MCGFFRMSNPQSRAPTHEILRKLAARTRRRSDRARRIAAPADHDRPRSRGRRGARRGARWRRRRRNRRLRAASRCRQAARVPGRGRQHRAAADRLRRAERAAGTEGAARDRRRDDAGTVASPSARRHCAASSRTACCVRPRNSASMPMPPACWSCRRCAGRRIAGALPRPARRQHRAQADAESRRLPQPARLRLRRGGAVQYDLARVGRDCGRGGQCRGAATCASTPAATARATAAASSKASMRRRKIAAVADRTPAPQRPAPDQRARRRDQST